MEKRILQEWNRGAERLTGFTKEEAVGKRLVQHFIADECHDSAWSRFWLEKMMGWIKLEVTLKQQMTHCKMVKVEAI